MFDTNNSSENKVDIHTVPDATLATDPKRIDVAGELLWLRPSDVLRMEVTTKGSSNARLGFPLGIKLHFSDGSNRFLEGATADDAKAIAGILWPADNQMA